MSAPDSPSTSDHKHHTHDTFSYRGWLVSDRRHRRAIAAAFYTLIVPTLLILAFFALMHLFLALYFVWKAVAQACSL